MYALISGFLLVVLTHPSFYRGVLYERKIALCSHPMPDENFPWHRCLHGTCPWCDAVSDWSIECSKPPLQRGPYRTESR